MNIFREDSIKKISSPEQLNTYMKVTNVSVWLLLAAILVLLVGIVMWSVLGRLQHTEVFKPISDTVLVEGYVDADDVAITEGMQVLCDDHHGNVTSIEQMRDAVYIKSDIENERISYSECSILIDSFPPISFLLN